MPNEAWEQLGMQAAGNAVGGIMGLALGGIENKRQLKQQGKLQKQQIAGNKEMMDYGNQKQLEMWKATSFPGQIEMMKKAGINPALMYGGGGPGGVTGGVGGSVQGATAQASPAAGMGMALGNRVLEMQLLKAQKENIEADTKNKLGDAANKPLVGANLGANTRLTEVETGLREIEAQIKGRTIEDQIDIITGEAASKGFRAQMDQRQNKIDQATMDSKMQQIVAEAIGAVIKNEAMSKGIKKTDAEIAQIAANIAQGWANIGVAEERNAIETYKAEVGEMGVIGHLANGVIGNLFNLFKKRKGK